jgi:transcriptional regulator with XRE-family HTH domain
MKVTGKDFFDVRRKYELTQKELADKLGIGARTVQNYEGGRYIPLYIKKLLIYQFPDFFGIAPGSSPEIIENENEKIKKLEKTSRNI